MALALNLLGSLFRFNIGHGQMIAILAAGSAWAEWVRMGEDSGQVTHYFDPKTIGKEGDLRTVRWLEEFRTKDATGVLSSRSMYDLLARLATNIRSVLGL